MKELKKLKETIRLINKCLSFIDDVFKKANPEEKQKISGATKKFAKAIDKINFDLNKKAGKAKDEKELKSIRLSIKK